MNGMRISKRMERRNTMQLKPDSTLYLREEKKKNGVMMMMRRRRRRGRGMRKKWLSFMYTLTLALFIDCALYLNIRPELLCTLRQHRTLSSKQANQSQFKSVSYPLAAHQL